MHGPLGSFLGKNMMRGLAPAVATSAFLFSALSLWGATVAAQPQTARLEPDLVSRLFADYVTAKQALFFSASTQICTGNPCDVTIALTTTKFNDKDYCIASLPETLQFPAAAGGNPPKGIRWTLGTNVLLGRTVEFHEDAGILKVDDGKAQFVPDNKRTSPTVFEGTNKHAKKATASYVPVILFRTIDGIPELCAAGDPKIVNP